MIIDVLIVLVVLGTILRNWQNGFIRQIWSIAGFFLGIVIGRSIESVAIKLAHTPTSRAVVTVVAIFGMALIGLTAGEYIGLRIKYHWANSKFNTLDNSLGTIITGLSVLLGVWLCAAVINNLPATAIKRAVNASAIVKGLNDIMPPAPNVISDLGRLIDPNGFPDVFIGTEPIPKGNVNIPSLGDLAAAVNADKNSVVRIEGLGCGGIVSGSGFVVGNGLVATDAHVVAGIAHPYVEDVNGRHASQVIYFDPNLDLAVLKTSDLAGKILTIDTKTIAPGSPGAVLGYPGGGDFNAGPAAVLDEFQASGRNIYGTGVTLRSVYEIQATVIPGNSGGPLVEENGKVMGVVFAQSTTYNHVGYALAMQKVNSEIQTASTKTVAIGTGKCAE